jgi:hypothetical protein
LLQLLVALLLLLMWGVGKGGLQPTRNIAEVDASCLRSLALRIVVVVLTVRPEQRRLSDGWAGFG